MEADRGRWRRPTSALGVLSWHGEPPTSGSERSVAIPTWHYGHEPPNVFGDRVAELFANALREDLLLEHSSGGLVVLPGAAGTVQEVFQMATRLYYETEQPLPPVILVGRAHWTEAPGLAVAAGPGPPPPDG